MSQAEPSLMHCCVCLCMASHSASDSCYGEILILHWICSKKSSDARRGWLDFSNEHSSWVITKPGSSSLYKTLLVRLSPRITQPHSSIYTSTVNIAVDLLLVSAMATSLRRSPGGPESTTVKFLFAVIKQLETKAVSFSVHIRIMLINQRSTGNWSLMKSK